MNGIFSPHLKGAKELWQSHLKPGDGVIDATSGNGHDTLFLSGLSPGYLYGYDLQETAIENTRKRVPEWVQLFCQSHEEFGPLPFAPRLIVYNLGYLPGGDKSLVTRVETTLKSVQNAIAILAEDGALSITCYPGHDEGQREEEALKRFLSALPSPLWRVSHQQWLNRPRAPSLLWVERLPFPLRAPAESPAPS